MVGREKLSVKLTGNKTHQQRVTFQKRKTNFFKKASELSTLCDIPLCAIVFEPEFGGCSSAPPETWPKNHDEVRRVIDLYKSKMSNKRCIDLRDVCKRSNEQLKKQIERTRRQNHGDRLRWINALPLDQLREVLGAVDRNIGVLNAKIECMKNGIHLGLIEGPEAPEMIDNLVHVDPLDTLLLPMQYSSHGGSVCLGIKLVSKVETEIKFSDAYAVEFINWGIIHEPVFPNTRQCPPSREYEMYRFTVHGVRRSKAQHSVWGLAVYTFGHKNLQTCQMWVNQIRASLNMETWRPKNLLVFIHPLSGKKNGCKTWETVAPIFSRAEVKTKVIVTQRAGHAFDVMASTKNKELNSYDGIVIVGGDGLFNEILNGLLSSRHKASHPPVPTDFVHSFENDHSFLAHDPNEAVAETSYRNEDQSPLIPSQEHAASRFSNFRIENASSDSAVQDPEFPLPNERFRFGIIPSGSTDAIVICTTGRRDPITSALQIVLGKRVCLDIAQIVRWRTTSTSNVEPCVRYAASFAGYGFYGDVITESEKYRWMGPIRYDYAGTKVFLKHRSYEAEIAFLEVTPEESNSTPKGGRPRSRIQTLQNRSKTERVVCRVNCNVCQENPSTEVHPSSPCSRPEKSRWLRSKGHFLSVGAAIISCRNERAPDGLVADAHLSDGFLHLILIKDCPRAFYLWHLTQLARKGGKPLNLEFVEHHKTPAFTFTASGKESVWNLDGETFQAHQLSAQVFRGLVSLFALGPEL